ncbi:hypothetical protein QUA70_19695 [Microcoleus sp. LAD1_D5]|uniref:hypothetical protein n=1 Tax=Microcoleus sp. LAD1_D5 TaxID=2818813 RepID=UPI002FD1196C
MKNIRWQLVEGIETVNPKEIPFLRVAAVAFAENELPKTHFQEAGEVPIALALRSNIALAKDDKEEILGFAYYKLRDFAPNSPYAYDGTFSTVRNRPADAIDTRLVLNQRIPDQELECKDIGNIIFTLHLDNN